MSFGSKTCRMSIAAIVLVLTGCASAARISSFQTLGNVGQQYAQTVQALLDEAEKVLIDTNSLELLAGRQLAYPTAEELSTLDQTMKESWSAARRSQLSTQDTTIRGNLDEMRLIARQIALLGDYFQALVNLATSKAPEAFDAEIQKTVPALNGLSSSLRGTTLFNKPEAQSNLVGGIGKLVVQRVQLGALRKELDERKETIADILLVHEALLDALRAQIQADMKVQRDRQYQREIGAAYADITKTLREDDETWTTGRRTLLSQPSMVQAVDNAKNAAKNLRQAWTKVLSDQLTAEDVSAVVAELQPIVASLEKIRKSKEN